MSRSSRQSSRQGSNSDGQSSHRGYNHQVFNRRDEKNNDSDNSQSSRASSRNDRSGDGHKYHRGYSRQDSDRGGDGAGRNKRYNQPERGGYYRQKREDQDKSHKQDHPRNQERKGQNDNRNEKSDDKGSAAKKPMEKRPRCFTCGGFDHYCFDCTKPVPKCDECGEGHITSAHRHVLYLRKVTQGDGYGRGNDQKSRSDRK